MSTEELVSSSSSPTTFAYLNDEGCAN